MSHQIENKSNQFVCIVHDVAPFDCSKYENNVCCCREKWLRSRNAIWFRARVLSLTLISDKFRWCTMIYVFVIFSMQIGWNISFRISFATISMNRKLRVTRKLPTSHTYTFFPPFEFPVSLSVVTFGIYDCIWSRLRDRAIDDSRHWKLIDNLSLNVLMAARRRKLNRIEHQNSKQLVPASNTFAPAQSHTIPLNTA